MRGGGEGQSKAGELGRVGWSRLYLFSFSSFSELSNYRVEVGVGGLGVGGLGSEGMVLLLKA